MQYFLRTGGGFFAMNNSVVLLGDSFAYVFFEVQVTSATLRFVSVVVRVQSKMVKCSA